MAAIENVSILFTDLASSTELAAAIDAARADELRRDHFAALRRAVATTGGNEIKNLGDGLMVVFGTASSALACSVAMQQEVDAENRRRGKRLGLRIGLSSGEVSTEDGDYFGEPVVEAARLCARAEAGQILVSDLVRATAGRRSPYELCPLGTLELKGLPEPVVVHEVAWAPSTPTWSALPDELSAGPFAFAGRAAQLERLEMAWKLAAAGGARLVLLSGEPGIGKTRLAGVLAARIHGESGTVLFGRCDEELAVPYQPFIEPLRRLLGRSPEAVAAHKDRHGSVLARLSPALAEVVGPAPEAAADPETERLRCFEAACDLIASAASQWPILLVLDDLHWAGAPTLALLRYLMSRGGGHPLLVVGTYRDTELDRTHPFSDVLADWRRQDVGERMALSGLDADEVATMMSVAAGHDLDEEALGLARDVRDETEGNPFFIGEVLRDLAESGAITRLGDRWGAGTAMEGFVLPQGVREVVGRRLGRLSESTQQVLAVASVTGAAFEAAVMEAVHTPPSEVLDSLEAAAAAGLLREDTARVGWFSFSHAIVRHTLLAELSLTRRTRLHREIADAIEGVHSHDLDSVVPELAYHFSQAAPLGMTGQAVSYAYRAFEQARERFAVEEAIFWLERAVEISELDPGSDRRQRAEMLINLAHLWYANRSDRARSLDAALRAVEVAREVGDLDLLAEAAGAAQGAVPWGANDSRVDAITSEVLDRAPGNTPARVRLLLAQALSTFYSSNGRSELALVDQASEMASELGDPTLMFMTRFQRPFALFTTAAIDEAAIEAEQVLEITAGLRQIGTRELFFAHGAMLWLQGLIQARRGELRLLPEARAELLRESTEMDVALFRAGAMQRYGTESMLTGHLDQVESQAAAVLEHSGDEPMFQAGYTGQVIWLRMLQGRLDEASALAEATFQAMPSELGVRCDLPLVLAAERGDVARIADLLASLPRGPLQLLEPDWSTTMGLYALAAAAAATHDTELGAQVYEQLHPYSGQMLLFCCILVVSSAAHAQGLAADAMGEPELAAHHFRAAVAFEEENGAEVLATRSRIKLAEILLADNGEEAQSLARRALNDAERIGMAHASEQAQKLLAATRSSEH